MRLISWTLQSGSEQYLYSSSSQHFSGVEGRGGTAEIWALYRPFKCISKPNVNFRSTSYLPSCAQFYLLLSLAKKM